MAEIISAIARGETGWRTAACKSRRSQQVAELGPQIPVVCLCLDPKWVLSRGKTPTPALTVDQKTRTVKERAHGTAQETTETQVLWTQRLQTGTRAHSPPWHQKPAEWTPG